MQRKKRTKSKLVKQFMNFLLAIALGISLLQLPQLSKEVKAENVNTNNGKQSQEMAGSYYLDKNRNSGKKVIAANAGLTPEDNLGPYIKYTIDGTEHTISWDEAVEKFRFMAGHEMGTYKVQKIIDLCAHLEELPNLNELVDLLY